MPRLAALGVATHRHRGAQQPSHCRHRPVRSYGCA